MYCVFFFETISWLVYLNTTRILWFSYDIQLATIHPQFCIQLQNRSNWMNIAIYVQLVATIYA